MWSKTHPIILHRYTIHGVFTVSDTEESCSQLAVKAIALIVLVSSTYYLLFSKSTFESIEMPAFSPALKPLASLCAILSAVTGETFVVPPADISPATYHNWAHKHWWDID